MMGNGVASVFVPSFASEYDSFKEEYATCIMAWFCADLGLLTDPADLLIGPVSRSDVLLKVFPSAT